MLFLRSRRPVIGLFEGEAFGFDVPIVQATKETLVDALRSLVEQPAERRRIGVASRAYVERVHDAGGAADGLLDIYSRLPGAP